MIGLGVAPMKKQTTKPKAIAKRKEQALLPKALLKDVCVLIEQSRSFVAQSINSGMVMLYWQIGQRIRRDILKEKRANYGEEIVPTLSAQLRPDFGEGFSKRNLFRMIRFAEIYPDEQIVSTLSRQLSWSHFVELIPIDDPLKRDFYAEMCRYERWSVRTLRDKIGGQLYLRTAIAKKPDAVIQMELDKLRNEDLMTPDLVFRDPYVLDFLELTDAYSEKDLEQSILREIERFILELGTDFAFIARQKRITIGRTDYYLDLLFFHRGLRCLIAIELKLRAFQPADKGQMELYLRWLDKYERREGEIAPLGLILCSEKNHEVVEMLQLDQSGMRVAEYLTDLPPQSELEAKLREIVRRAKELFAARQTRKATGRRSE